MTAQTLPPVVPCDIDADARLFYEIAALMIQHRLTARGIDINQFSPHLVKVTVDSLAQVQQWADVYYATVEHSETARSDQYRVHVEIADRKVEILAVVGRDTEAVSS